MLEEMVMLESYFIIKIFFVGFRDVVCEFACGYLCHVVFFLF